LYLCSWSRIRKPRTNAQNDGDAHFQDVKLLKGNCEGDDLVRVITQEDVQEGIESAKLSLPDQALLGVTNVSVDNLDNLGTGWRL
jgi:hypothetical protein